MVLIATSKYGAGVSSDAVRNLSAVDSLLDGRGFTDLNGQPLTLWPPLYPMILYAISRLTGADPFISAWYLNVILYVLNVWLAGWFFSLVFREKTHYAIACALAFTLSRSLLSLHANVSSDPLFIAFIFIYFLIAAKYLQSPSGPLRWWLFIISGLAVLQRFPGIVFFAVSGLLILYKEGFRSALRAIPQALIGILPSVAWAYFFTYTRTGTFFGPRTYGIMFPLENANLSLTRMVHWFVPFYEPFAYVLLNPWIILIPLLALLLIFNRKQHWLGLWKAVINNIYVWPYLVFSVVYFIMMLLTVVTVDHLDLYSDRYYIILFPLVLILLCYALENLVLSHFDKIRSFVRYAAVVVFVLWLAYPILSLQEYLRLAVVEGEPSSYNIQNTRTYRESKVIEKGRDLMESDPEAAMYSNYANVIWFAYRQPVDLLPVRGEALSFSESIAHLNQKYSGWPHGKDGYLIWFKPNQYHHVAQPRELAEIADLELIYEDKHGAIYRVTTR